MNVTTAVETRITRPVYFRGVKGQGITFMSNVGKGHCTKRPVSAVKVTRLSTGKYSVRSLGGGMKTLYLLPSHYLCMVTPDGDLVHGLVKDVFAAHSK